MKRLHFTTLSPRYANADRDQNRVTSMLVDISGSPLVVSGFSLSGIGAVAVAIVDGSGSQITTFGGGTQYQELATTSPATGTLVLGRYVSSLPTLTTGQLNEPMLDASSIMMMNMAYKLDATNDAIAIGDGTNTANVNAVTGKNGLYVTSNSATGSAVPATAFYMGLSDGTNLRGVLQVANATNSTGTGIVAAGILAQLDDTSPTAITENQFGNLRMTTKRALNTHSTPDTANMNNGKLISASSTNATSVVGNAATIKFLTASNINASPRYLKIYNKATAPTVGTDTPVHTYLIPGNASGAGTNIPLPPGGIYLGTGFGLALTTGVADADTGAVAASDIVVNYSYENIA